MFVFINKTLHQMIAMLVLVVCLKCIHIICSNMMTYEINILEGNGHSPAFITDWVPKVVHWVQKFGFAYKIPYYSLALFGPISL